MKPGDVFTFAEGETEFIGIALTSSCFLWMSLYIAHTSIYTYIPHSYEKYKQLGNK